MNNKLQYKIILTILAVFSLMPVAVFGACYSNTGSPVPSRVDGTCYPGTYDHIPNTFFNQTNPPEGGGQTGPVGPTGPLGPVGPNQTGPVGPVGPTGPVGQIPNGSGGQVSGGSGGLVPSVVSGGGNQPIQIPNPLGVRTFGELINRLVNWLLIISAPILTLMIIIGAFQIMTGAGEPEKITKGRHTITYAIIGYALLLISTGITKIIADVLGAK